MPDLILHHYDTSPFSEKVKKVLAHKGVAWHAVEQPTIMPKPQLVPLTGGMKPAVRSAVWKLMTKISRR